MIVVDGGGAKAGAIQWLKQTAQAHKYAADGGKDKTVIVYSLSEFIGWAHTTLR